MKTLEYLRMYDATSTLHIPDTQLLVELGLVLCFSCRFYRQWRTGPQCPGLPGAQWIWGQRTRSQVLEGVSYV